MYLTFTNKNIEIYFKEIHSNTSLTKDEETELFGRLAMGDTSVETIIFNKMSKLAVAMSKLYTGSPELLEDLIQEANMGILIAIRKFDPALGNRFSSYARWWMKANITAFLNKLNVVHPSNTKIPDLVKKIRREFYQENQREISEYELMEKIEDMGEVVTDVSAILNLTFNSIDQVVGNDGITYGECG